MFSKDLYCRHVITRACLGKERINQITKFQTRQFADNKVNVSQKLLSIRSTGLVENVGEVENAALSMLRAIYPFPTMFSKDCNLLQRC